MGTEEKKKKIWKIEAPCHFLPLGGMRKTREIKPGATYHVVARVNRSEFILESDVIKEMMMTVLKRAKKKYKFRIKHFVIMGNHIHLLIEPEDETSLSRLMQWILSVFAMKYNKRYKLKGHVWYDRFKSKIIRSFLQFYNTFLYISDNPVKAHLCTKSEDYRYSAIHYRKKNWLELLGPLDLMVIVCLNSL